MSADKRQKNFEKIEQELKEIDKNETVIDIQGELLLDPVDNSSKRIEAVNDTVV